MLSSTGLQSTTGISNAKNMRRLHLSDNELTGTFPTELFKLTELRTLYLSFNSFTGLLPTHLSKISHMEQFYAFGNMFNGTLPGNSIAKMTNLRELILANNFLEGEIPDVFNSMSSLEQLSLYGQQSASMLNGTVPKFLNSPKLWYFDASDNDLSGTIPVDFMKNSLYHNDSVSVYLSNNELTGTVPSELASFTTLDLLIVGNKITGLPSEFCGKTQWMQNKVGLIGSCDAVSCYRHVFDITI
jgi:Leucine-rich repeat (LRR) protein